MNTYQSIRQPLVAFLLGVIFASAQLLALPALAIEELPSVPDDPRWEQQWGLADQPGVGINVREAWRYGQGESSIIAVVDSGIVEHPEFAGRVLPGYDFISSVAIANDGDGRDSNPSDPGNWVSEEEAASDRFSDECKAIDSNWHGTHVAGIALAATGNGVGIAGVAPLAKLLPIRVVGKCGGTERDLIDAIRWAGGIEVPGVPRNLNVADVINLSLGSERPCSPALQSAIDEVLALDIAIVASVGNNAQDASLQSPANCFGTLTVSALASDGSLATYSNFGLFADLAAPGGDSGAGIISTVDRGTKTPDRPGYASYWGTSMAAPHVSGVLAIAREYDRLTPLADLLEVLLNNLAPFTSVGSRYACSVGVCGAGALDAALFLQALEARQTLVFERTLPTSVTVGGSAEGVFTLNGEVVTDVAVRTPETCSYDGKLLIGATRGICTLEVRRAGTARVKPVQYLVNIEVGGLRPTIGHQLPPKIRIGSTLPLHAESDSGGVLTYKSRTPAVCSVGRKGRVAAYARGTCKIRINVAASGGFDAGKLVVSVIVRR